MHLCYLGYNPNPTPPDVIYDLVTEPPQLDGYGYNYEVPENQLNPPKPTTTQLPIEVTRLFLVAKFFLKRQM